MKVALTIAGSDPSGGAGIQADLKVFSRFAVYGISSLSAVTAQNSAGVSALQRIDGAFVYEQLEAILSDIRPDALKTGMLLSAGAVRSAARMVSDHSLKNLVVDPVILSSSGANLLERQAVDLMMEELFPLAEVIPPNIAEASTLTRLAVTGEETMQRAAIALKKTGPRTVIITGGHLENETLDLLFDGRIFRRFRRRKIPGEFHGTGCAFSAAITALLAKGASVAEAAEEAGAFVCRAIESSLVLGKGMRLLNL
jgi:hydroxymethylpyrimidine/phosphomethylpyrimidine kinase